MAKKAGFLPAVWSERWQKSYAALPPPRQRACDEAAMGLIKQQSSSGLRIKPILPDKYYHEARIGNGDRIVFRIEAGAIHFIDVVSHDDIDRYGRRARSSQGSRG
jgi:hypothetical protein